MISLEIAISNFKSVNYQEQPVSEITLKFGQISTTMILAGGQSGKCLYLDLSGDALQEMYMNYACGLFIMNRSGKYFSLMSFQKLKIEDKIICNDISFFNDLREVKFTCQFSLVASNYKSPKLANTTKFQQRQNALDLLKKPPIPKQTPLSKKESNSKQQIKSFLYGKGNPLSGVDQLQTLKQDLRKKSQVKTNLQKIRHGSQQLSKAALSKQNQYLNEEDDPFENNPPMMEFTNEQLQTSEPLRFPQLNYIQYEQSIEKSKNKVRTPKQNNFLTFNRNQLSKQPLQSPQTPSQFELVKKQTSKGLPPKRNSFTKQQIKQMAKEQAQSIKANQNVMIPIARGNQFQLVPLSALKPQQIIQYVQKQRKNEEKAFNDELRRKRLDQREREIEQKNRKLQQLVMKRQENITNTKKSSKQIRTSIHKEQIKQQENDQEQQNEEDYMDDFQSMSASNSIIRSRISSRGNAKNISKEQQSIMDDQYSQDFDSYSHSMLSKTNKKNQAQSISDYSQSISISQSYRK